MIEKCPEHPGAGVNYDHWPSFGAGVHLGYCKECSKFLGQIVLQSEREITGETQMQWGKYTGKRMIDIPDSYLQWCIDSAMGSDAWQRALVKYLQNRGGKK